MIHSECYHRLLQDAHQCPICSKSLGDMTSLFNRVDQYLTYPIPEEFANKRRHISCCDCAQRSVAKFHFLYHKCGHCGSYSTKILDTFDADNPDYQHLGDVPPPVVYNYIPTPYLSSMIPANRPQILGPRQPSNLSRPDLRATMSSDDSGSSSDSLSDSSSYTDSDTHSSDLEESSSSDSDSSDSDM